MASKLLQMKSKACEASKFVSKHGTTYYKHISRSQLLLRNAKSCLSSFPTLILPGGDNNAQDNMPGAGEVTTKPYKLNCEISSPCNNRWIR
ncbi:unnamed protein product [Brassica oleracea var. botrytis]|uniref:(rape) hypothetical protein n=1 Tax=Brassica napus TaxID=3708 RepID=A0A816LZI1_BRANA|nr:unnamed protein product [Brassica napus]